MSHFFAGYLKDIYRLFDGDLATVIVIAELAHHNLSAHFSGHAGLDPGVTERFRKDNEFRGQLHTCNALSLAAATGLPRETVRRKLLHMEKLGWFERCGRRDMRITPRLLAHFFPDFNVNLVTGLLENAQRIHRVLFGMDLSKSEPLPYRQQPAHSALPHIEKPAHRNPPTEVDPDFRPPGR